MKIGKNIPKANADVISGPRNCPGDETSSTQSPFQECFKPNVLCLMGGGSSKEGNVYYGGKPVCDDSWDAKDGLVVCKQLGFHAIVRVTKESHYGKVSPNFAMDNVGCTGTEKTIDLCEYNANDDCGGGEGAGVICDERSLEEITAEKRLIQQCFDEGVTYDFGSFLDFDVASSPIMCQKHCQAHPDCNHFSFYYESSKCYRKTGNVKKSADGAVSGPRNCSDPTYLYKPLDPKISTTPKSCDSPGVICLAGGSTPSEGNVLVGNRPVCDDDWNLENANVVCKELGFLGALSMTKESRFGPTGANFIMDQVSCDGTEERLIDCDHADSHDCGPNEAAGVICDVRTEKDEALLEASCFTTGVSYSPGKWIDFEIVSTAYDCQVHCLSHSECSFFTFYLDTHKCYRKNQNTENPSPTAISGPRDCNGTSNVTKPLVILPVKDCNAPGVVCLRNGATPDEGNVYVGGKAVCDDSWDTVDARVVCKELGYADVLETYIESHFGQVPETFAMDNVDCDGTETSLVLCHHEPIDDCGKGEGAGVKCDNRTQLEIPVECNQKSKICLIGGSGPHEGNIYFEGKPICDDGWTFANAHVVCTSLGFGMAKFATKESEFGIVPSVYGMTEVQCNGSETEFTRCPGNKVSKATF